MAEVENDIITCAIFYIAQTVPQHELLRDMYSYWRISKSSEVASEEQYKAFVIYGLLREAHEMAEARSQEGSR